MIKNSSPPKRKTCRSGVRIGLLATTLASTLSPDAVAVVIVDQLEVVDVQHKDDHILFVALGQLNFARYIGFPWRSGCLRLLMVFGRRRWGLVIEHRIAQG